MSSPYIVSARKYRPATFSSVVGQDTLTRTLKNAIDTGRLAQAYLFCGPRGVGKTSCARIFARTINCEHRTADGEACGECDSCRDFEKGVSYNVIELDAASNNGVENMRTLTEQVNVPPASGRYRVFIIDEVHMLSSGAFNAFLKTLEEPPAYAIFILATTEKNKVLPTILSRCQTYDFARLTERDISRQLRRVAEAEGIVAEDEALEVIARKADGAMRDALSIFDQITAASGGNVTYRAAIENLNVLDHEVYFRFTEVFAEADVGGALMLYREVRDGGFDARLFVNGLAEHVRNMLVAQSPATVCLLDVGESAAERYVRHSAGFTPQWYYAALELLQECDLNFREATDKQLLVELALIRLCQLGASRLPNNAEKPHTLGAIGGDSARAVDSSSVQPQEKPQPQVYTSVSAIKIPAPPRNVRPQRNSVRPQARSLHISEAGSISKSDNANGDTQPASDADPSVAARAADPELLEKAWESFIAGNSDKKLLLTAMRSTPPRHIEGAHYELTVCNQAQMQEAEAHLTQLADHLRRHCGNSLLTLSVREQEPAGRPRHMTPAETLTEMIKTSPATARLLELIDAEQI